LQGVKSFSNGKSVCFNRISIRGYETERGDDYTKNKEKYKNADSESIDKKTKKTEDCQVQGAGHERMSAEKRRLHPRLYYDPEKAEFGHAESRAR